MTPAASVSLAVQGPYGTGKTALALPFLSLFGPFSETNIPATFDASAQGLEPIQAGARDVLLLVDDLHPGTAAEERAQADLLNRLLREGWRRKGRQRAQRDGTARDTQDPASVLAVTVEALPSELASSSLDRGLILPLRPGTTAVDHIEAAHEAMGCLPLLTVEYLRYLCRHWSELPQTLRQRRAELEHAERRAEMSRSSRKIADLMLGLECFSAALVEAGVWGAEQARSFRGAALMTLRQAATEQ